MVQAALIISLVYTCSALDKIGCAYVDQAIAIAVRLELFDSIVEVPDKREQHARSFTAWAVYNFLT